jgi:hypothetical protein
MLCFAHHHASWHAFHHIKPRIICIRVVHTRVFWIMSIKSRSRSIHQRCWCLLELSEGKLTSLQRRQAPDPVAEPPKLYGPHAPVIVPKTSDCYVCTPDNLRRSVGCPHRTPIQLHLTTHTRINKGVTTTLQMPCKLSCIS